MKKRYKELDYLKAIGVIVVIFLHTLSRYKNTDSLRLTWDMLHFAVGMFVFASGFLVQMKTEKSPFHILDIKTLWRRIVRLMKPYYIYAIVHFLLFLLLPVWFNQFSSHTINLNYLWDTIITKGGIANGWIPRIFFDMTLVYVVEQWLEKKTGWKYFMYISLAISLGVALWFGQLEGVNNEWMVRFIPWYAVFAFGRIAYSFKDSLKKNVWYLLFSAVGLVGIYCMRQQMGLELGLFKNKYPPSFYYVFYQLFLSMLFYIPLRPISEYLERFKLWDRGVMWFSVQSYNIFFAHVIAMDLIYKGVFGFESYWIEWGVIMGVTVGLVYVGQKLMGLLPRVLERLPSSSESI